MPRREPAKSPPRDRFAIYRLKHTPAAYVGHVDDATDEADAIAKAIERFAIDPAHRDRLIARRVVR